jgi:hypothetical protein
MNEANPLFWRRINPVVFLAILAVAAEVSAYLTWRNPWMLGVAGLATLIGTLSAMFALSAVLRKLGKNAPHKKFVAEVVVLHWRGETPRFWGVYRYEWLANFAVQYLAYMLDHWGNVHWEFGIQFRVHDRDKRQANDGTEAGPDADEGRIPEPA